MSAASVVAVRALSTAITSRPARPLNEGGGTGDTRRFVLKPLRPDRACSLDRDDTIGFKAHPQVVAETAARGARHVLDHRAQRSFGGGLVRNGPHESPRTRQA